VFGLPITAYYLIVITVVMWIVREYTPMGRYLYAIGANQRAAQLNGIPTRKYVIGAFVASGTRTALAGVLLAAKLRIAQASVGLEFLLPALVGAFFGLHHVQAGPRERLGHRRGCDDPGSRHLGDPAIRRFVLGRAAFQRGHVARGDWRRGLCAAQEGCGLALTRHHQRQARFAGAAGQRTDMQDSKACWIVTYWPDCWPRP
jgi:hypothetical protein